MFKHGEFMKKISYLLFSIAMLSTRHSLTMDRNLEESMVVSPQALTTQDISYLPLEDIKDADPQRRLIGSFDLKLSTFNSLGAKGNLETRAQLVSEMNFIYAELQKANPVESNRKDKLKKAYQKLNKEGKTKVKEATFGTMIDEMSDTELEKDSYKKVRSASLAKIEIQKKVELLQRTIGLLSQEDRSLESQIQKAREQLEKLEDEQSKKRKEKETTELEKTYALKGIEYQTRRQTILFEDAGSKLKKQKDALASAQRTIEELDEKIKTTEATNRQALRETKSEKEKEIREIINAIAKLEEIKRKMEKRIESKDYLWSDYNPFGSK